MVYLDSLILDYSEIGNFSYFFYKKKKSLTINKMRKGNRRYQNPKFKNSNQWV